MNDGRGRRTLNRVGIAGGILGLLAAACPFIILKANRVDRGSSFFLWSEPFRSAPLLVLSVLIIASSAAAVYASMDRSKALIRLRTGSAVLLFILPVLIAGFSGTALIGPELPFGRVSPAAGFWLTFAAGYLVIQSVDKERRHRMTSVISTLLPPVVILLLTASGFLDSLSLVMEYRNRSGRFISELFQHLRLTFTAVSAAILIGVPAGFIIYRLKNLKEAVFLFVNTIQTIPSLALFGLMIAPLSALSRQFPALKEIGISGIGNAPALIALSLYALLPVVRNTYTSLSVIESAYINAGIGMGMNRLQLLFRVEIPLSVPVILSGIRISTVQAVGNTAVSALIGAGGLGTFIFQGLGQAAPDLILLGVLPVVILAILIDRFMEFFEKRLSIKYRSAVQEPGEVTV